jgi:hypothetical protein
MHIAENNLPQARFDTVLTSLGKDPKSFTPPDLPTNNADTPTLPSDAGDPKGTALADDPTNPQNSSPSKELQEIKPCQGRGTVKSQVHPYQTQQVPPLTVLVKLAPFFDGQTCPPRVQMTVHLTKTFTTLKIMTETR